MYMNCMDAMDFVTTESGIVLIFAILSSAAFSTSRMASLLILFALQLGSAASLAARFLTYCECDNIASLVYGMGC